MEKNRSVYNQDIQKGSTELSDLEDYQMANFNYANKEKRYYSKILLQLLEHQKRNPGSTCYRLRTNPELTVEKIKRKVNLTDKEHHGLYDSQFFAETVLVQRTTNSEFKDLDLSQGVKLVDFNEPNEKSFTHTDLPRNDCLIVELNVDQIKDDLAILAFQLIRQDFPEITNGPLSKPVQILQDFMTITSAIRIHAAMKDDEIDPVKKNSNRILEHGIDLTVCQYYQRHELEIQFHPPVKIELKHILTNPSLNKLCFALKIHVKVELLELISFEALIAPYTYLKTTIIPQDQKLDMLACAKDKLKSYLYAHYNTPTVQNELQMLNLQAFLKKDPKNNEQAKLQNAQAPTLKKSSHQPKIEIKNGNSDVEMLDYENPDQQIEQK